jgi:hypothetical protein
MTLDQAPQGDETLVGRSPTDDSTPATDGQAVRPIDKALLGGAPQRVGRFEYRYDTDSWTWSDTVSRMHPEDLTRVKGLLHQSAAPFSSRHRIRTASGDIRNVVAVGDAVTDADNRIVATKGFYVDLTDSFNADIQESISDKLDVIVSHREIIDQAKGMLMALYQLNADAAFGILRWRSQELNVKLATVAAKLVAELPELVNVDGATRAPIDHYLMTLTPPDSAG